MARYRSIKIATIAVYILIIALSSQQSKLQLKTILYFLKIAQCFLINGKFTWLENANCLIICILFSALAIKCWRCSSDITNAEFCKDPFDESRVTEDQKRRAYVNCPPPFGQLNIYSSDYETRIVCKKQKQKSKGLVIRMKILSFV